MYFFLFFITHCWIDEGEIESWQHWLLQWRWDIDGTQTNRLFQIASRGASSNGGQKNQNCRAAALSTLEYLYGARQQAAGQVIFRVPLLESMILYSWQLVISDWIIDKHPNFRLKICLFDIRCERIAWKKGSRSSFSKVSMWTLRSSSHLSCSRPPTTSTSTSTTHSRIRSRHLTTRTITHFIQILRFHGI